MSDSNWKDKLTSYNGNAITYDEIGNPLSYYNGHEFEWQNGRQLASVSGSDLAISYKYNSNGIRTQKTVNDITTNYTLEGSNVVKETNGTDTLWYYYDATGSVISFELNGAAYFYVKNLQGDIVAISDASGNKVVDYLYDSWGKLISITGSLADTVGVKNPYRYRGYRYDTELGMYYLQSRYYDPALKRFINADGFVSTGQGILGNNMFAYCNNCVVVLIDTHGNRTNVNFGLSVKMYYSYGGSSNRQEKNDYKCPFTSGITIDIGIGIGVGVKINIGILNLGAVAKRDIFHLSIEGGELYFGGERTCGGSISLCDIPQLSIGSYESCIHPINCRCGLKNDLTNCPYVYDRSTDGWEPSFSFLGGSTYVIFGATLEVGYDPTYLYEYFEDYFIENQNKGGTR